MGIPLALVGELGAGWWMVNGEMVGQSHQGQGRRRMCMWQAKKINKTCEDAVVLLFATFTFATRSRLLAGQAASDVVLQPPFILLCHLFGLQLNLPVYVVLLLSLISFRLPALCTPHQHTYTQLPGLRCGCWQLFQGSSSFFLCRLQSATKRIENGKLATPRTLLIL